jgi:hypothetical protein
MSAHVGRKHAFFCHASNLFHIPTCGIHLNGVKIDPKLNSAASTTMGEEEEEGEMHLSKL